MGISTAFQAIRKQLVDNLPVEIPIDNVSFPNDPADEKPDQHQLALFITVFARERTTLGARQYRTEGTVTLTLSSPKEKPTTEHDTLVDTLIPIFNEAGLQLPTFEIIEFYESVPSLQSENVDYWSTSVVTEFYYNET